MIASELLDLKLQASLEAFLLRKYGKTEIIIPQFIEKIVEEEEE